MITDISEVITSEALKELHINRDEELRAAFKRSLPFQDGLFDRWERAKRLGFGEGTSIYNSSCVYEKVSVGCHVWIGPNTLLDGMGGELIIGDYSVISAGVQIYTHDTVLRTLSGGKYPMHRASVKIGKYCQIAPNAVISAGVEIGDRCLVAVNSFVNKSFPQNTIIGGCPAQKIGSVVIDDENNIELIYSKDIYE